MSIETVNDYISANKQKATITKTVARPTVAAVPFSVFDVAGSPGAGVLAGANATSGIVPVDDDIGYPTLTPFASGALGYLSRITFSNSVASRLMIYDRLYVAGAFSFNAAVTLTGQPSYAGRVFNNNFRNTELWIEWVAASTGIPVVTVTYTNDLGVAGRTTGAVNLLAAQTIGRCTQLPLQSGDNGVQRIESVTCTTATAGTFNVQVLRGLAPDGVRIRSANDGGTLDMASTGLLPIGDQAAIYVMVAADATSTGAPSFMTEIASK